MTKTIGWMLITKRGVPKVTNSQLPIFWRKKIALEKAELFKCGIKRLELDL